MCGISSSNFRHVARLDAHNCYQYSASNHLHDFHHILPASACHRLPVVANDNLFACNCHRLSSTACYCLPAEMSTLYFKCRIVHEVFNRTLFRFMPELFTLQTILNPLNSLKQKMSVNLSIPCTSSEFRPTDLTYGSRERTPLADDNNHLQFDENLSYSCIYLFATK